LRFKLPVWPAGVLEACTTSRSFGRPIFNDEAYWGCGAGVLYVLDPDTGKELRRFVTNGRTEGKDGSNGIVYLNTLHSHLYAVSTSSGNVS